MEEHEVRLTDMINYRSTRQGILVDWAGGLNPNLNGRV